MLPGLYVKIKSSNWWHKKEIHVYIFGKYVYVLLLSPKTSNDESTKAGPNLEKKGTMNKVKEIEEIWVSGNKKLLMAIPWGLKIFLLVLRSWCPLKAFTNIPAPGRCQTLYAVLPLVTLYMCLCMCIFLCKERWGFLEEFNSYCFDWLTIWHGQHTI